MRFGNLIAIAVAGVCVSGGAWAGPIDSIVVYGDSLSDNGNYFAATGMPGAPYYNGRRSNGPMAVEQMATMLGVPLTDYAYVGATTGFGNYEDGGTPSSFGASQLPGMLTQLKNSPNAVSSNPGALFIVWGGPDDFLSEPMANPLAVLQTAVGNLVTIVGTLKAEGATDILVPGMPDIGLTPYYQSLGPVTAAEASALTDGFNAALQAELPSGVTYVDTASLLRQIVANPGDYGFTNVKDACYSGTGTSACADPNQYVFFDDFHPTFHADTLVADAFIATVVPEPDMLFATSIGLGVLCVFRLRRKRRIAA
jgi:phospholipase/lecithinase/hemolysin